MLAILLLATWWFGRAGALKAPEVRHPELKSYSLPTEGIGPVDVVHVVDGDTIVVNIDNRDVTVRLYGIDTPETVKPNTPVACYGTEASDHTKQLLTGRRVTLKPDPTQDRVDKYGRTLAYVWRDDGLFVNLDLVENAFAREYTYKNPYQYQSQFRSLEATAKANHAGLWNPLACPFGSFP